MNRRELPDSWPAARRALARALREIALDRDVVSEPSATCASPPAVTRRVDERIVQAIWNDRFLKDARFQTASGKALEVVDPGRWNTEAGPDFLGATLRLAGEETRGDVEIHAESADWTAHGHDRDAAYSACALHAFLWASDDRPYDALADGRRLERFEMGPHVEPEIDTLRRTLNLDDYPYGQPPGVGVCHKAFVGLDEAFVERALDLAGRERVEAKARRLADQLPGETYDQVFYQALMVALGHKGSKTLYFLLSKRLRYAELLDYTSDWKGPERVRAMEALLLRVAGLWPSGADGDPVFATADAAARDYRAACDDIWRRAGPYLADRLIPPTSRWKRGVRPANFPERRLAGVAHLAARMAADGGPISFLRRRFEGVAACPPESPREVKEAVAALARAYSVDEASDFWARRFTLAGKPTARPQAQIGGSSAESIVFNVALPMGILWARRENKSPLENALWELLARFPALDPNAVTRFMERRLFGDDGRAKRLLRGELRRQALFHVFADCCNNNEKTCSECLLLSMAREINERRA